MQLMKKREDRAIKYVIKLGQVLKARSLADKIAKDTTQFILGKAYKPLLEGQTAQTKEITKTQKETSKDQLQQQHVKSQEEHEK